MASPAVSLDDKYLLEEGRIFVTGTQALVRLPMVQRWRDRAAGLDTAGFVTGYRGSPLGGIDQAFGQARRFAEANDIRFQAGLNEDIAATAVLGTQQINLLEKANKQGVFAMWYGKGPGVDRSGDAFRHGNLAGSAPYGGVLLLAGDDHTCKSSTTSHQSEYALMDAMIPVLNPAGVQEILDYGLYGWALSRYSGCWTAMKLIAETVDSSASIVVGGDHVAFRTPSDFEMPAGGPGIRWPDSPQEQERRLHNLKLPAALAFARANRLDRVALGGPRRRLGIVTTGKSYLDVRQALEELGISEKRAIELGLSIYKVGMVWPLEPEGIIAFSTGLEELLIVEEKRPLLEGQVKDILYNMPADRRPCVYGKRDGENRIVLPAHDDLNAVQIARAIAARILPWLDDRELVERIGRLSDVDGARLATLVPVQRTPYFCSGCPHNTSTRVPEGSRALAGIGCHWMSQAMDRNTATYTHMGGEGANWIGQSPYVPTRHVFQNLGDGTYFHSGLLAIRAAVAARVNITYKVLFNDATAMTGGQRHDGTLNPQRITHQIRAEGVERIAVVSDDTDKYAGQEAFAANVSIHHRDELDAVQRELREVEGVSAIVYDQTCAAEKRRRRKRDPKPRVERRVIINELVCEGCGDCSKKSNCLSVTPIDTEFGRKRRIDQSSCNEDLSCVKGFCPSFVTVEGAKPRRPKNIDPKVIAARPIAEPAPLELDRPWNVLVTGIGGTGVITIGALLAMAAHLEGKGCSTLDMAGMAQKGGPVTTHLRFAPTPQDLHAVRISSHAADLVLGCDLVVAAGKEALGVMAHGRTRVVLNSEETITGAFTRDPNFRIQGLGLSGIVKDVAGKEQVEVVPATQLATGLLGDSIGTNLFMVGYAWQQGLIPVSAASIDRAIELNGAAVEMNRTAFRLGRLAAADRAAVEALLPRPQAGSPLGHRIESRSLDEIVSRRTAFLTSYQNARYAGEYRALVERVRAREKAVTGKEGRLSEAVARYLFKLMAYKDEYEVARLYSDGTFRRQIAETFDGKGRLTFHLAPPLLAKRDPNTGEPAKMAFGPWMMTAFGALAKFRFLRGTAFDPFSYTAERRTERALIGEYRQHVEAALEALSAQGHAAAVAIAEVPEEIRGYGHVKEASIEKARARWRELGEAVEPQPIRVAAE
ncbi:indolepyruvate ferredoxin oxidoreductase family protein [Mesorhizobium sp. PUT5]|uniref:indolepyruvate ferredoxin oxidoreductase family protein n=1 Tax=Mesorhizobium sp. PUT5 TaxID=3454629 RepID=UPI003FA445B1